ncbi:MAG: sigma-70 family RNA polymerase sigma factor [Wenzhouxiangellaceae bacterium]|nr:sigma-70 family RNA polymerase sigma factor [Wenzhouxiangellaceae bacterium]
MKPAELRLESVLQQFGSMISRIADNHEADPVLRQDLLQEISLAVWKALKNFRREANVRTFVARIAHNRAVDHLIRQSRGRERDSFDENVHVPHHKTDRLHEQMDLSAAMHRLPLGYRQVMGLMLEGFQQAKIAQALGLSEDAVAQRQSRGRQKLKDVLGEQA